MAKYIQPAWQQNAMRIIEMAGYISKEQLTVLRQADTISKTADVAEKRNMDNFVRANRLVLVSDKYYYPIKDAELDENGNVVKYNPLITWDGASSRVDDEIWFILFTANFVREKLGANLLDISGVHRYKSDFFDFMYMMNPALKQPRIRLVRDEADGLKKIAVSEEEVLSMQDSFKMAPHHFEIRSIGDYSEGFDVYAADIYKRILAEQDSTRYLDARAKLRENLERRKGIETKMEEQTGIKSNPIIICKDVLVAARFFKDFYTKGPYTFADYPLEFWKKETNTKFVKIPQEDIIERVQMLVEHEA